MNTYLDKNGHFTKDAGSVSGDMPVSNFSILTQIPDCGAGVESTLAGGNGYSFPCEYDWTGYKLVDSNCGIYRVSYTAKNEHMKTADELLIDAMHTNAGSCIFHFYSITF